MTRDSQLQIDGRAIAVQNTELTIKILEFLVGSLVTGGGFAFTYFGVNDLGKSLGAVHLSIGLASLVIAFYLVIQANALPRTTLLIINAITIGYSASSATVAAIFSLLPPGPTDDSIIGTIMAIIISSAIVYLLLKSN